MVPENVKIQGSIMTKDATSTSVEYVISDGTGSITCKQWIEKGASENDPSSQCVEGSYVSVTGVIKEYSDILSIQIFRMTPVEDWNEMTHHLLEVVLTHNMNLKGPIPGSDAAKRAMGNIQYNMGMGGNSMMMSSPAGPGGMRANNDTAQDEILLKAIKATGTREEGTTVEETLDYLVKSGNNSFTKDKIDEKVRGWYDDGLLYSTFDEVHFRSCDADN